jgi:anti-sigma factor RsiW
VNPNTPRRPRLTRDDSRALDGVLPPAEAARVAREQAADPARAHAVAAYREAAGLWAEDARRAAQSSMEQGLDPQRLLERVLASDPARLPARNGASWGYAAAAMALFALGVAELWTARPDAGTAGAPSDISDLERGNLAVLRSVEIDSLPTGGR